MALIELEGAGREYHIGENTITALAGADLRVEAGELLVVLGPSGSGKTTLLNILGALDQATSGRVVVDGVDLRRADRGELARFRRDTVSFVFQTFNLFPSLTAGENVQFALDVARKSDGDHLTAAETLERVGLGDRIDHFPHQLSGGEQQRVAIARALVTRHPLMLADEPTGELDYRTGLSILDLLQRQTTEGIAVIVVTHNREIARCADRVVELSSGRIVADAPPPGGRSPLSELSW